MDHRRVSSLLAVLVLGIAGCRGERRSGDGAPLLVPAGVISLEETDSAFIGQPQDLAVLADGRLAISDAFQRRVLLFGRDGRFERALGRPGRGPGELSAPTWLAAAADSLLFVVDGPRVLGYDLRSGALRAERRLPRDPSMLAVHDGTLLAGYGHPPAPVAVLELEAAGFRQIGHLPALLQDPLVEQAFGTVAVAAAADRLATAFALADHVYLQRLDGTLLDSIRVPAARRRGVRSDLIARLTADPPDMGAGAAALYASSRPRELAWLPSGLLALVTVDWEVVNGRVVGDHYLSLVDPPRRRSCVDARVPAPRDPLPALAVRGDTLFVLEQRVTAGVRAVTRVRLYRILPEDCTWRSPG